MNSYNHNVITDARAERPYIQLVFNALPAAETNFRPYYSLRIAAVISDARAERLYIPLQINLLLYNPFSNKDIKKNE